MITYHTSSDVSGHIRGHASFPDDVFFQFNVQGYYSLKKTKTIKNVLTLNKINN